MVKQKVTEAELKKILTTNPADTVFSGTAAGSDFVKILSRLNRSRLMKLMTDHRYETGDIIFCEGDEGDAIYLIWAGRVAVVKGSFSDPTEILIRTPGEVVGEMAILENKPRWASLVALEDVRVLRIEREGFHELLQSQPAISLNILATLSARLRAVHEMNQADIQKDQQLRRKLSTLIDENEELMELQRVRQETSDLIIHDLRSPLNNMYSVLNMLELVLPEDVLEANRELLDIARLAYSRMQDLVDSLLDVSMLEAGELSLDLSPVNLKVLVDEVVAMASFAIDQHSIVFQTHFASDLPMIEVDEDRIRRVLTNLIDNAVKYTPRDGLVKVDITAERDRIFERFAQVQRAGMRLTRGFGLGLAFCRLAVEAHGGEIWVEVPEDQKGSRFVFTLPIRNE